MSHPNEPSFHVETADIANFADLVERQHDYAQRLLSINIENIGPDPFGRGIQFQSAVNAFLLEIGPHKTRAYDDSLKIVSTLDKDASSLRDAVNFYTGPDKDSAKRLDKNYMVPPVYTPDQTGTPIYHRPLKEDDVKFKPGAPSFADVTSQVPIKPPKEATGEQLDGRLRDIDSTAEKAGMVAQKLSVNYWVREILKAICGTDVIADLAEFSSGDWGAYGQLAGTFELYSKVFWGVVDNMKHAMYIMQSSWQGNAADQMQVHMEALVTRGTANHADFLHQAAERMWHFAKSLYHTFTVIDDFVGFAIDLIAGEIFKLGGQIGKAFEKVLDVLLKADGGMILTKWNEVVTAVGEAKTALHAFASFYEAFQSLAPVPDRVPLPGNYDHPEES